MDYLRDNIWQFVLGFLGIIVTVFIYFLQRRKKSLAYQVVSNTSLLTGKEGIERNIKILFGERQVKNVHLVILRIFNDGDIPVVKNDFDESLKFYFGQNATILSAEVIHHSPKSFEPKIDIELDHVAFYPTLLNSGDTAILKILLDGDNDIFCKDRIAGVKVRRVNESFSLSSIYTLIGIIALITGSVLFSLLLNAWSSYTIAKLLETSRFTVQFIIYIILILVGLLLVLLRLPLLRIKH